jgi:phage baseplate assembly protein W
MATPVNAFHFPVAIDAGRGQLRQEPDYARYVSQLVRQVILTAPGERAHRPDFGAGLRRMVFAPIDDTAASLIQATIFQSLNQWLGSLITVDDVRSVATEGRLDVTITYTLKARGDKQVLNLEVTS